MKILLVLIGVCTVTPSFAANKTVADKLLLNESRFMELRALDGWRLSFDDTGVVNWQESWFRDGMQSKVTNSEDGMTFTAGPKEWDAASHAVLWTRKSFSGDIRMEYDYTRLDTDNKWVNILYIQATGTGAAPYTKDIAQWTALRNIPAMKVYFENMKLLHISYAAFGGEDKGVAADYVRARRYPLGKGEVFRTDTALAPDYLQTSLFKPGVTYHVTVLKKGAELFFAFENDQGRKIFKWSSPKVEEITEGRVGFRHMWRRSSKYKNIRVYEMKEK
ncbi:DUF1961 family protein [Paremcibacter congregatus]|uniref:DUF1961 family protein n=1 Tax=Paremcibacter congregatus TaxID=2043170 RepID=UPI003A8E0271